MGYRYMNNAFNSENYPDRVPEELTHGALFAWKSSAITAAYPTTLYTLRYVLTLLSDPRKQKKITASKVSSEHVVSVTDTSAYDAGEYRWRAEVVRDSDSAVVVVDEGITTVNASIGDVNSHVYTVLAAIRATIEGTASQEQSRIEIAGRILEYRSIPELVELEREYAKRWQREKRAMMRKAGKRAPQTLISLGA